jgi:hypothetical protein
MKDPYEVLRAKEQEVAAVKQQVEALRIAARLLDDDETATPVETRSQPTVVKQIAN